jgi:hypothetical protein
MAKCLARFGSAAVIGLGGSTSPGVSLPRLSIRSLSPQLDHFLSAQRELRELFWSFEQATLASGLFFGRRRWISKAVDLDASKAENRCASGRTTFALPSGSQQAGFGACRTSARPKHAERIGRRWLESPFCCGVALYPGPNVLPTYNPVTCRPQRLAQPVGFPTWRPRCTRAAPGPSAHSLR